jgi:hypothetical protein
MLNSAFPGGGVNIKAATATPNKVLAPYTFFAGANKGIQEGTIPSKSAATITPGTTDQTIAAGQYLSGDQTIAGDADLVAGNIRRSKNVFGVDGTFGLPATITAGDDVIYAKIIEAGKTGTSYVDLGDGWGFTALLSGTYRIKYCIRVPYMWSGTAYAKLKKNNTTDISSSEISADMGNLASKTIDVNLSAGEYAKLQVKDTVAGNFGYVNYFAVCILAAALREELQNAVTGL